MNPDTVLEHVRNGVKKWSAATDKHAADVALRDAINAFELLDSWLTTGGRLPLSWQAAHRADGPDPDYLRDGVIAVRQHGYAVTLKNTPVGTFADEEAARIGLEREMAARDYWPYAWLLRSNLGAPESIDLPPLSERRQYYWWILSKPSEAEFSYSAEKEIGADEVPAIQAELNAQNTTLKWRKFKILRGDQVSP